MLLLHRRNSTTIGFLGAEEENPNWELMAIHRHLILLMPRRGLSHHRSHLRMPRIDQFLEVLAYSVLNHNDLPHRRAELKCHQGIMVANLYAELSSPYQIRKQTISVISIAKCLHSSKVDSIFTWQASPIKWSIVACPIHGNVPMTDCPARFCEERHQTLPHFLRCLLARFFPTNMTFCSNFGHILMKQSFFINVGCWMYWVLYRICQLLGRIGIAQRGKLYIVIW